MTFQDSDHAGELLSALLDGELSTGEADRVLAHVGVCTACAHELDLLERARAELRSLPELDPPGDFIEGIVRRRHRILVYGSAGGLMAAVLMTVVAFTSQVSPRPGAEPQLAAFADEHSTAAATVPNDPGTISQVADFTGIGVENEVAGLTLVSVERTGDAVHALYRGGDQVVSLFHQAGPLDWSALPDDGRRRRVGQREVMQVDGTDALVVDAGGVVVTLVGGDQEVRSAMAEEVPDAPGRSWYDRARDACQQIVRAFGLE